MGVPLAISLTRLTRHFQAERPGGYAGATPSDGRRPSRNNAIDEQARPHRVADCFRFEQDGAAVVGVDELDRRSPAA